MALRRSQERMEIREYDGLEVTPQDLIHGHNHPIYFKGPATAPNGENFRLKYNPDGSSKQKRESKRRWIIVAVAIAVVVFVTMATVGGIVGGIMATQAKRLSSTSPLPTMTSTTTAGGSTNTTTWSLPSATGSLPASKQASVCRGGICSATLDTVSWTTKQFIFGLTETKSLVYKARSTHTWDNAWADLGGSFGYIPAIMSWAEGRINIIAVHNDKTMSWKSFQNSVWDSKWTLLGPELFASAPTSTSPIYLSNSSSSTRDRYR